MKQIASWDGGMIVIKWSSGRSEKKIIYTVNEHSDFWELKAQSNASLGFWGYWALLVIGKDFDYLQYLWLLKQGFIIIKTSGNQNISE